ncbi:MAG: hypothetical protein CSA38_00130 [Flavobacteriales bacterium]|nr:MAG: hypothetical protein CSA38_00130 [Flavobacteriales bacterium]
MSFGRNPLGERKKREFREESMRMMEEVEQDGREAEKENDEIAKKALKAGGGCMIMAVIGTILLVVGIGYFIFKLFE